MNLDQPSPRYRRADRVAGPPVERMVAALDDPRKRMIARFALERRGEWTVDQLHERHPEIGPVRDAHTLCMQLAVVGLLAWIPTDETRLRHQPFRLRDLATAAAALASHTV